MKCTIRKNCFAFFLSNPKERMTRNLKTTHTFLGEFIGCRIRLHRQNNPDVLNLQNRVLDNQPLFGK